MGIFTRISVLLAIIALLLVSGCASQAPSSETADAQGTVETETMSDVRIVKPCPDSCDDGDEDTLDICSEKTGYECRNVRKNATEIAEDLMRDVNAILKLKYLYVPEEDGKVTHYVSYGNPEEDARIVFDVLDYRLDEINTELYLQSEHDDFFMDAVEDAKDEYDVKLEEDDYYFEGKGFYDYVNHTLIEHVRYDNLTLIDGLGYYESVYSSIDIAEVELFARRNDHDYREQKFFIHVPFEYRLTMLCKPDVVIHLYPVREKYQVTGTGSFVKTQETSYVLNHYRDVRKRLIDKADKISELCD